MQLFQICSYILRCKTTCRFSLQSHEFRQRTQITETDRLASLYTLKDKRCPVFFTSFLVIFLYTNLMYTKYSTRKKQKQNKSKYYSHSSTKYSYISAF